MDHGIFVVGTLRGVEPVVAVGGGRTNLVRVRVKWRGIHGHLPGVTVPVLNPDGSPNKVCTTLRDPSLVGQVVRFRVKLTLDKIGKKTVTGYRVLSIDVPGGAATAPVGRTPVRLIPQPPEWWGLTELKRGGQFADWTGS